MRKSFFFVLGFACLILGAIGAVLPLLPTTPFVLLAAYCFARSSPKFHQWLLDSRLFGPTIIQWEQHGVIPFKVKCLSTSMMLLMVSYPVFFKPLQWWVDALAVGLVMIALLYIWSKPSCSK